MEIIDLNRESSVGETIVALGNFDGIHIGHQALIDNVLKYKDNLIPSILLFKQHSNEIFLNNKNEYITSISDKIDILEDSGIERIYLIAFDDEFMKLSPEKFAKSFLYERLGTRKVVVGEDYTFGYKALGVVDDLKEFGKNKYEVITTKEIKFEDKKISSTWIKDLIRDANFHLANKFLGRNFKVKGTVVDGSKRGRTLGFPTANTNLSFPYVLPKFGLYLTKIYLKDSVHYALTNCGINPTFIEQAPKFENYILDFNRNIYGEDIEIEFIEFLREEIKFNNVDDLIDQMHEDERIAREKINKL